MPQTGTVDINETLAAWADIVIKIWHEKIVELKIYDKGALNESLLHDMLVGAGNDIQKIEFSFKLYGIFVDMGVGREISKGNSGDLGFTPTRKPREWFSKKYYGQVMKLREILMEKYSKAISYSLINTMQADFDQRFDIREAEAKTVSSLRTVRYRNVTNQRNARNYANRRQQPGRWTNDHKTWKPD